MGYTYTGDALLRASFEVMVPQPLDNRTVVNSEQELYTIPESSAYRGMTVANPDDGNIYMLVDKSKRTERAGWKSSGISIITCSQADYQALLENTNLDDYSPIDSSKDYLRQDSYYYIPEDETGGTYLTKEWGDQIVEQLGDKANQGDVTSVINSLSTLSQKLSDEYTTTEVLQNTYATIELTYSVEQTDEKFLTKEDASANYTTKESFNALQTTLTNDYVTKEDLRGSETEGDDFIFVTQIKYNSDRNADATSFQTELLTTTSTKTQGLSIQKIEEKEVVQEEETIIQMEVVSEAILTTEDNKLFLDKKQVALTEEIPVIEVLSQTEYDNIPQEEIDPEKYYYTYDDTGDINNGYVTKDYVDRNVYSEETIRGWIYNDYIKGLQDQITQLTSELNKIVLLEQRIAELEAASSNLDQAQLNKMKLS